MYYFFILFLMLFITGCNSDNDITTTQEPNATVATCTNHVEGSVSNLGNAMNTLGYYGDGVYFGKEFVVGKWDASETPSLSNIRLGDLTFSDDGRGEEWTIYGNKNIENYGLNEDGTILYYHTDQKNSYNDYVINLLTIVGYEDCCYTVKHELDDGSTPFILFDTYKLCKVLQE